MLATSAAAAAVSCCHSWPPCASRSPSVASDSSRLDSARPWSSADLEGVICADNSW